MEANLLEGYEEAPEQPEPMTLLRKFGRFSLSYWQGGYADQPSVLMQEFYVVSQAEIEHENVRQANRLFAERQRHPQGAVGAGTHTS